MLGSKTLYFNFNFNNFSVTKKLQGTNVFKKKGGNLKQDLAIRNKEVTKSK